MTLCRGYLCMYAAAAAGLQASEAVAGMCCHGNCKKKRVTVYHKPEHWVRVPVTRASVATDGDSRTAMDGAKCPLEWESEPCAEELQKGNRPKCQKKPL